MTKSQNRPRPQPVNNQQVEILPIQTEPLPSPEETLSRILSVQELRGHPLMTLVSCPDVTMRGDIIEQVYTQLRNIGKVPQLDVFLCSAGGQTEIPWRLITLIRDFCERFTVLIPGIAHSAATHLAMGADEIIMGPLSELSPVDPVRAHPLLPSKKDDEEPLPISVQDLRHCVKFIRSEIDQPTPETMAALFSALFDKVHPLAIGAIQQSYELARLISTKALSTHMDPEKDQDKINRIVNAFSDDFFSHGYRIGWKEARGLGLNVVHAEETLWDALEALYQVYRSYFAVIRELGNNRFGRPLVWIDTTTQRCILEQSIERTTQRELKAEIPPQWMTVPWVEK